MKANKIELLKEDEMNVIKWLRMANVKSISVETELRYILTFIEKYKNKWVEVQIAHKETADYFKDNEKINVTKAKDGTWWLGNNEAGWD